MRKKFTMLTPVLLMFAAGILAACGNAGDEADPLDRELDLAMAEDSLAALADTAMSGADEAEAPVQTRAETPPPRRDPPRSTAPARTDPTPDPEPPPAPATREVTVSAGTLMRVTLDQELSTETSNVGDVFTVTLIGPVTDVAGLDLPAGTKIQGEVTALEVSGGQGQQAVIRLDFGTILLGDGQQVALTVTEANATTRGRKSTEEKAVTIGAGAVVGGILGRVIGGNATGTIIGGVAGAAAGTAIALGTEDVDAVLEEGSEMTLRVEETFTVRRPV